MAQESYPTQADRFKKWSEAMLRGATVGKPSYSKRANKGGPKARKRPGRFRRKRRKKKGD